MTETVFVSGVPARPLERGKDYWHCVGKQLNIHQKFYCIDTTKVEDAFRATEASQRCGEWDRARFGLGEETYVSSSVSTWLPCGSAVGVFLGEECVVNNLWVECYK